MDVKKGLRLLRKRAEEAKDKKYKVTAEITKVNAQAGENVKKSLKTIFKKATPKSQM